MNKHASRGCIDESSTTGNMGEDLTMDMLIVRARITEMIQVFMMRPFPSLEINFQIYKKKIKNKKNNNNYTKNLKKKKIINHFQPLNHQANVKFYLLSIFSVLHFRCFSAYTEFERYQGENGFKPHGFFSNILIHFRL